MQLQQRLLIEQQKKSQKDAVYFPPEDNHETKIAEREKV